VAADVSGEPDGLEPEPDGDDPALLPDDPDVGSVGTTPVNAVNPIWLPLPLNSLWIRSQVL
jgi:hypothetical protein